MYNNLYDALQLVKSKGTFFDVEVKDNSISFLYDTFKYKIKVNIDNFILCCEYGNITCNHLTDLSGYLDSIYMSHVDKSDNIILTGDTLTTYSYINDWVVINKSNSSDYIYITEQCLLKYPVIEILSKRKETIEFTLGKTLYKLTINIPMQGDARFSVICNDKEVYGDSYAENVPRQLAIFLFINSFIEYILSLESLKINGILNRIKEENIT